MAAGEVANGVGIPPNTLSFHLDRLRHAGLLTFARQGRSLIYAARYDTMNSLIGYLTENCCGGKPELRKPVSRNAKRKKRPYNRQLRGGARERDRRKGSRAREVQCGGSACEFGWNLPLRPFEGVQLRRDHIESLRPRTN